MTPEEERQLDAEADAYQAEADEIRLHEACRAEADALKARLNAVESMNPYERVRDCVERVLAYNMGPQVPSLITSHSHVEAQLIAASLNRASKVLPTASRFVFLDVLAGELGRFADEVRAETHDEGEPR